MDVKIYIESEIDNESNKDDKCKEVDDKFKDKSNTKKSDEELSDD